MLLLFCSCSVVYSQKITVDTSVPLNQLILDNLFDGCVEISNISSTVNGNSYGFPSYAYFNKSSSNFPFQDGVMLSTGNAASSGNTSITTTLNEGSNSWGSDTDLEAALGITNTLNATSIEFDIISISNQIQFNYLFASEEYSGIYLCDFSDSFAVLIKETASAGPYQNIALVPGTGEPVAATTIHDEVIGSNNCPAKNEQYFDGYSLGDTNYDGRTVPLTATATVIPYTSYHIKLVIADQGDFKSDSSVFIKGISVNEVDLGDDISTCLSSATLNADIQNPLASYTWYLNNNLIPDENNPTLNAVQNGTYKVEVSVPLNTKTCILEDEVVVTLNTEPVINPISDFGLCDDSSSDGTEIFDLQNKVSDIISILPSGNYNLKFYYNEIEARSNTNEIIIPIPNSSNPQEIYVSIENTDTGCFSYAPFNLVVNSLPSIITPLPLDVCDNDGTPDNITDIDLTIKNDEITSGQANLNVTYHFTQADANSGNNPIGNPYINSSTPSSFSVFARVQNTLTGCISTTTLDVNVRNSPIVNTDIQYIDACDTDHDGFDNFDLTQVINDVLQGLAGVTTSFHLTYNEAESGTNPISNPSSFDNTTENVQEVYLRVEDSSSGCPTIVPVQVHTNLLLTGTNIEDYALCDDETNDGIGDFYLNVVSGYITNDIPNIDITFYESQNDLDNNLNPIDETVPYTATSPKILYIDLENTLTNCHEKSQIKLLVNPVLLFKPAAPVPYCDTDQDGVVDVDLHSLDDTVNNGNTDFEVHYFLTLQEAKDNNVNNEIYTYPVSGTQTFYARIVNIASGCHTENSFDIIINPAPAVSQPSDIIICDTDQDGFYVINLQNKIPEIVSDPTGLNIGFFTSLNDAQSGSNIITNPSAYNSNTQTIYVRVENTNTGCSSITNFNVIVSTQPIFPSISNYETCESDGDEKAEFLFSDKDSEILNSQTGKEVLYFEDSNYTIPIDKNTLYTNISSPQTIYVRVQNTANTNCSGDSSFTILVSSNPVYNTNFEGYLVCDDSSNDGKNVFDLNEKIAEISQGSTGNLNITFHTTLQNAENNTAALPLQYTNATNPQTLYVRIQETNSSCYLIDELGINIIAAPDVTDAAPFIQCDNDYDGISTFNLNDADVELLDRVTTDLVVTYFENEADVEDVTKEIANPSAYNNLTSSQTVYIKITNSLTGCYTVKPLDLIVNTPPTTNQIGTVEICDNNTNTYDLSQINSIITNDDINTLNISYHNSMNDAQNNNASVPYAFNYTSNFYTFFTRIENINTGCISIVSFNLQINPNPIAVQPSNLFDCDDDYDGFMGFDLSLQNSTIIGLENPNDFSVTYYTTLVDAENGNNPLNYIHSAYDGEVIFARMENISTGCFDTTSFSTTVYPLPVINVEDIVPLCMNDLPLIINADTGNSGDTYLWSTGETTNEIQLMPEDLGDYWVTITTPNNCQATKSFSVIQSEEATINFTTTIDFADPNSITVNVSGIGSYVYILDNGEPQTSNVFENVTFGPHTVTIRDLNGCNDVSKEVVVIDVPKFVTPNNDGYFDTWQIVGIEQLPGTVVYIYDRHGKLLKTLPSSSIGWDGTYRGANMPSDDYWFLAKVKKDGVDFDVKGHFALKR
ncbi:choice-of-anchor L domain-containing protein [Gaetbulibacter sp. M235]|uniref:T9SS type B sorting domain-containing protein n=1 Tax=Gaetbulibacter sp. M235 TaxID=3126510 RepID=UPI00374FA347